MTRLTGGVSRKGIWHWLCLPLFGPARLLSLATHPPPLVEACHKSARHPRFTNNILLVAKEAMRLWKCHMQLKGQLCYFNNCILFPPLPFPNKKPSQTETVFFFTTLGLNSTWHRKLL